MIAVLKLTITEGVRNICVIGAQSEDRRRLEELRVRDQKVVHSYITPFHTVPMPLYLVVGYVPTIKVVSFHNAYCHSTDWSSQTGKWSF
jgi:hypothetical protein